MDGAIAYAASRLAALRKKLGKFDGLTDFWQFGDGLPNQGGATSKSSFGSVLGPLLVSLPWLRFRSGCGEAAYIRSDPPHGDEPPAIL